MLQIQFAPQMWAARPHLGSIFKKLLHRKTFYLPAARILCPLSPQIPSPPIMPTFFVKYLTNIPESSIIRESVFFAGFGKARLPSQPLTAVERMLVFYESQF